MSIEQKKQTAIELENNGEFAQAIQLFDEILDNNPRNGEIYFYKGKALITIAQFEQALESLTQAKQYGFGGLQMMMYPVIALSNMKEFKQLDLSDTHLEDMKAEVHVYFADANDWTQAGAAYQMLGQYESAYKSYQKALRIDPNHKISLENSKFIESISKIKPTSPSRLFNKKINDKKSRRHSFYG